MLKAVFVAVALSAVMVGCGDDPAIESVADRGEAADVPTVLIHDRVALGVGGFPRLEGQSTIEELLRDHDVLVGRVTASEDVTDGTIPHKGMPVGVSDADRSLPRHDPSKSPPITSAYDVEVVEIIDSKSRVSPGQSIRVIQPGGIWKGTAYEFKGDPVIEVGRTYFFFLRKVTNPGYDIYGTLMWGRFQLDESDRLQPASEEWDSVPVVQDLRGLPTSEAIAKIQAAAKQP